MICIENGDHKGFVQLFAEGIRQDVKRRLSQYDFSHFFDWHRGATLLLLSATGRCEQKQIIVVIRLNDKPPQLRALEFSAKSGTPQLVSVWWPSSDIAMRSR